MIKRGVILCLCAAAVVSCGVTSKQVARLDIPELQPGPAERVDVAAYERKYGKNDGVILSYERNMEHCGIKVNEGAALLFGSLGAQSGRWDYIEVVKQKFVILNPDASAITTFTIGTKPKALYIRLTTPDGVVRQYGLADLQEEKDYGPYKNYKFAYPGVVKGTIVEEGYQFEISGMYAPMDYDLPLQFDIPCEKLKVSFAYPDWWRVAVKHLGENDSLACVASHDAAAKKTTLTYEARDIPPFRSEPYAPYFKEVGRYFEFMITDVIMKGMEMHLSKGWIKYADEVRSSVLKKSGKNAEQIRQRAADITRGCPDSRSRIDSVLAYVRTHVRQGDVSKNGDFVKVLADGEGSSLDIAGLTYALLKGLNMQADLVLVHSAKDGYFDPAYVNLTQFSMPAVTAKVHDSVFVLLPHVQNLPSNHTPDYIQGQTAMPISEESAGLFEKIPPGNLADNIVADTCDVTVDADGKIQVRERRLLRGLQAYLLREIIRLAPEHDAREAVKSQLPFPTGSVRLDSFTVVDAQTYDKPLLLDMRYSLDNLAVVTADEVVVQTADLLNPMTGDRGKIDPADRQNPIKISYDERYTKHIVVHFPDSWNIAGALEDRTTENALGSTASRYVLDTGSVTIDVSLALNKSLAPRENVSDLAALIGGSADPAVSTIVFRRGETTE